MRDALLLLLLLLLVGALQSSLPVLALRCSSLQNSTLCTSGARYCQWKEEDAGSCVADCSRLNSLPGTCVDNKCDYDASSLTCIAPRFIQQPVAEDVFCYRYESQPECSKWTAAGSRHCVWNEENRACERAVGGGESPVPEVVPPPQTKAPTLVSRPTAYPTTPYPTLVTQPPTRLVLCSAFERAAECGQHSHECVFFNGVCLPRTALTGGNTGSTGDNWDSASTRRPFDAEIDYWVVVCSAVCVLGLACWLVVGRSRLQLRTGLVQLRVFQLALLAAAVAFFCLDKEDASPSPLLVGFAVYAMVVVLVRTATSHHTAYAAALEAGLFFSTPLVASSVDVHSPLALSGGIMLEFALAVLCVFIALVFTPPPSSSASAPVLARDVFEFVLRVLSSVCGVVLLVTSKDYGGAMPGIQLICALALQLACMFLVALAHTAWRTRIKLGLDVIGITMAIVVGGTGWLSLGLVYLWGCAMGMSAGVARDEDASPQQPQPHAKGKDLEGGGGGGPASYVSPSRSKVHPPSASVYTPARPVPSSAVVVGSASGASSTQRRTHSERRRTTTQQGTPFPPPPPYEPQLANV